jgi:hypothetical protein
MRLARTCFFVMVTLFAATKNTTNLQIRAVVAILENKLRAAALWYCVSGVFSKGFFSLQKPK